jgi:polar amino acid transport system ATP-binding protein
VCFLHEGSILEDGTPQQIFTQAAHERTRSFLGKVL